MLYGAEKAREMSRSILPSLERDAHQRQTQMSRAFRARADAQLREIQATEDGWLDFEGDFCESKRVRDIKDHVQGRRLSDHLNHFYRWSEAVTTEVPIEDRLTQMSCLLDDGLIGRHAMTHLEEREHFKKPDAPFTGPTYRYSRHERARRKLVAAYTLRLIAVRDAGMLADLQSVLDKVYDQVKPKYYWVNARPATKTTRETKRMLVRYGNPDFYPCDIWGKPIPLSDGELKTLVSQMIQSGRPQYRKVLRQFLRENDF